MTPAGQTLSRSVLVRVCSSPLETFALGGLPALFEKLREQDVLAEKLAKDARDAARDLGDIVNSRGWSRQDARALGALQSRVARMAPSQARDLHYLDTLPEGDGVLAMKVRGIFARREALERLSCEIDTLIETGGADAAAALWSSCAERPELCQMMALRDPEFYRACLENGASSQHWTGKKGRHRAEYLKGILRRATFRTIPREWYTHVTVLPVANGAAMPPTDDGRQFATVWQANIHRCRKRASEPGSVTDGDCPLTLAPLSWRDGDRLCFCVSDWDNPFEVKEVGLKASSFFMQLYETMSGRALSFRAIETALRETIDPAELEILPEFVAHLISQGVMQACPLPEVSRTLWQVPETLSCEGKPSDLSNAFLDVYRRWKGGVPSDMILQVQTGVAEIARLSFLIDQNWMGRGSQSPDTPGRPTPLIELAKNRLMAVSEQSRVPPPPTEGIPAVVRQRDWPLPLDAESGYGRLLAWIGARLGEGRPIRLPTWLLDDCGAPAWNYPWPCDAMVRLARPGADYVGVFDEAFAAGSMDARFVPGIDALGFDHSGFDFYRSFLEDTSRRTGIEFVELLFPPLSLGAANAVTRPDYGLRWTGDPASATYFPAAKASEAFVPLDRFMLRETPHGHRLFLDDRPVITMYHATRLPIAPWNVLTQLMLNAAPAPVRFSPRRMHRLLDAFPEARHAPRLEVEGGLVVCCEQWRLGGERLWRREDDKREKMRIFARLRNHVGLPRFVFLSPAAGVRPIACDLDDPSSIAGIEEVCARHADPLLIAMTPDAGSAFMRSGEQSHSACGLIRLPADRTAEEYAAIVVPQLQTLFF